MFQSCLSVSPLSMMQWTSLYRPPCGHGTSLDRASQPWFPLRTLDLTGQGTLLVASVGYHCSNLFTSGHPPTSADNWWLLKHIQWAQAGSTYPTGMLFCCAQFHKWKTRQYPRGIQILVSTYLRGAPQVKIEKS